MKNEQQNQTLLLKVDPGSTFRNNFLQPATNVFVAGQVDHAGGAVASWLVRSTSERGPGSSPGRGHCAVFLGKTLYSHGASLHPGV